MTLRNLILYSSTAVALLAAAGCSDDSSEIAGTWKRIEPGDSLYRGFTLGGNGIAASLNQTTTQYNAWHRKRDTLWLSGIHFADTAAIPFTDTLLVKKITDDSLVIHCKEGVQRFLRE